MERAKIVIKAPVRLIAQDESVNTELNQAKSKKQPPKKQAPKKTSPKTSKSTTNKNIKKNVQMPPRNLQKQNQKPKQEH